MESTGIPGYYKFEFDTAQCSGSYVSWGDYDYNYESDHFQLERKFSCNGVGLDLILLTIPLKDYLLDWNITTLPGLGLYLSQGTGTLPHM